MSRHLTPCRAAAAAGLAVAMPFGCADPAEPPGEALSLGAANQPILAGFAAASAEFDHTGALAYVQPDGDAVSFCGATLIAPRVAVTAKHCAKVLPDFEKQGGLLEWRSGPSVEEPRHRALIAAVDTAPGDVGGYVGEGRDVAVVRLDRPIAVEPVELAAFDDAWLGRSVLTLGYGIFSPSGAADGTRRVGRETIVAVSGRVNEALFGNFESFVEWSLSRQVTPQDALAPPTDPDLIERWRIEYELSLLLEGHEAVGGTDEADLLSCRGDSGGPLLRVRPDGTWESGGVISGGPSSTRSECDFGSVYATFGPTTLAFLTQARHWVDPCEGVAAAGSCEGDTLVQCFTNLGAAIRRPQQSSCAEQGLRCHSDDEGAYCAP